jgi:predicted ester cyclase
MSNRQNFAEALECFADPSRRHDYFRLYSDDIVLHGYQGVEPGLESVERFYNRFWAIFPDARVTVQELIEQGDTLVARYVITGTQHQAFMDVAAAGQRIELPGISILHFKGGQCFERWACSNSLLLLSRIGAPIPH